MIGLLASTAWATCEIEVVGSRLIPQDTCLIVSGTPPEDPEELQAWAAPAVERILDLYITEGYTAARAWTRVRGGQATIEVDEGQIHRVRFLGVSSLEKLTLADNLDFAEGGVLHQPTLEESLARMERSLDLRGISWTLSDGDDLLPNQFGMLVPERVLDVRVVSDDDQGFGVDISAVPLWGLVTGVTWDGARSGGGDNFHTGLGIALPYQQWILETEPTLRWVYGRLDLAYRAPSLRAGPWSPVVSAHTQLAQYQRLDLGLHAGLVQDTQAGFGFLWRGPRVEQTIGVGFQTAQTHRTEFLDQPREIDRSAVYRPLITATTVLKGTDGTLREDLQEELRLDLAGGFGFEGDPIIKAVVTAKAATRVRRDDVVMRFRGLHIDGRTRFFDQFRLAGDYQRVYFSDKWWVETAAQLEVGYRKHVVRDLKVGAYHDLSFFLEPDTLQPRLVNAAGPGIHLFLLDAFAFDLYYGIGVSPDGTFQNLSLDLSSVY